MIKNVIFDIGNVLINFKPYEFYQDQLDEAVRKPVCDLIFKSKEWLAVDEGSLSYEDLREDKIKMYPNYRSEINLVMDGWMQMMSIRQESLDYALSLKERGFQIYLLSNLSCDAHHYIEDNYHIFELFDGMLLSYQNCLLKPDPEIYKTLLRRFELRGDECIFIDDMEANILQSRALGIFGVVYENLSQVKKDVELYIEDEKC